jgi:hypothetical protein
MKQLVRSSAVLAVLVALLTLGLVAPGSAASSKGAVKGVVKLDGAPVKGVRVELHLTGDDGFVNRVLAVDTTNSKGAYSFRFATADPEYDHHTVIVRDPAGRIVSTSRWFADRPGRTVTRNVGVQRAASISGSVTRGDGRPTARLRVEVFGPFDQLDPDRDTPLSYDESVPVATDGRFSVAGLPAGDYYLGFVDQGKTYFTQCYGAVTGSRDCDGREDRAGSGAPAIRLTRGQHVDLAPQVMTSRGSRITGTVTDTSGHPIRNASVTAVRSDGTDTGRASSSARGSITIGPLLAGARRLSVQPPSPWAPQSIDLASGDVSGLQVKLKSRAKIAAKLTPGTGTVKVTVDVTRSATGSKPSGAATIRWGEVSKTVRLVKGKGTVKLSQLPKGKRQITVSYAGTASTAATTKVFHATVR